MFGESRQPLTLRVVNTLYVEAMVLADEARACFDQPTGGSRNTLAPLVRVRLSCESLKVTTRLMHIVAWLLTQRAAAATITGGGASARLGRAAESDVSSLDGMPEDARKIIIASTDLYERIQRLDARFQAPLPSLGARTLQNRLNYAMDGVPTG